MDLDLILTEAVGLRATDVHLRVGRPVIVRVDGGFQVLGDVCLTTADTRTAVDWILRDHKAELQTGQELDIGYALEGLARFRANIFTEGGQIGVVMRIMPREPRTVEELNLPPVLSLIASEERGLVLVTRVTGSGKSTTLAAMIDHINRTSRKHIITIEDPIEYVYQEKKCLIT